VVKVIVFLTYLDIVIASLVSIAVATLAVLLPNGQSPLYVTLGLLMVLLTPGYVLVAVLFPRRNILHAGGRIALSMGLSFVIVALTGFFLSYSPWGVRHNSVAVALALITLTTALLVVVQRIRLPAQERFTLLSLPIDPTELRRVGIALATLFVLGTVFSFTPTLSPKTTFTEFYLLGKTGDLTGYPRALASGEDLTLNFGIKNLENEAVRYRLEGQTGSTATTLAEPTVQPGETWEQPLRFSAPLASGDSRLEFDLYRDGDTAPYRTLYLNIIVTTAEGTPAEPLPRDDEPEGTELQRTATAEPTR
jgi:uncharacterized membrane protein